MSASFRHMKENRTAGPENTVSFIHPQSVLCKVFFQTHNFWKWTDTSMDNSCGLEKFPGSNTVSHQCLLSRLVIRLPFFPQRNRHIQPVWLTHRMEKCFLIITLFHNSICIVKSNFASGTKFPTALSKSELTKSFIHNQNILDRNQIPLTNTVPHDYKHPDTRTPSARASVRLLITSHRLS